MRREASWFNYATWDPGQPMCLGSARWFWHRYGRTGFFRSVDLNAVGWAAVLGPGIVLGLVIALAVGWPWWLTTPAGMLCTWIAALVLDGVSWRRTPTSAGVSDLTSAQIDSVLDRLRKQAVEVSLHEDADPETGAVWLSIQSSMRFLRAIQREIDVERRRAAGVAGAE